MDADIIPAEGSQRTENGIGPRKAVETRPPRARHFIFFYGRPNRDAAAAAAAAKVFLESVIYAGPGEAVGTAKARLEAGRAEGHYVVRLPAEGKIAIPHINRLREVADAQDTRLQCEITVHLTEQSSGGMPPAVGHIGPPERSIFDFMVISQSIFRRIRRLSDNGAVVH